MYTCGLTVVIKRMLCYVTLVKRVHENVHKLANTMCRVDGAVSRS